MLRDTSSLVYMTKDRPSARSDIVEFSINLATAPLNSAVKKADIGSSEIFSQVTKQISSQSE